MIYLLGLGAFCWLWVRRRLEVDDQLAAFGLSFALANVLLLFWANWFADVRPGLLLCALIGAFIYRSSPAVAARPPQLTNWGWACLTGTTLLVYGYTSICQNLWPDDDYWIHAALQGLLARDGLPVLHPFFSEITMSGHYGRDLLIASTSRVAGMSLFHAYFWHTMLCQLASLWLLFSLTRRASGSRWAGFLCIALVFFGINAGGRAGLLDTFQNNNALAYLLFLALIAMVMLVHEKAAPERLLTCAFSLGMYGIIYETHFGLVGLVLIGFLFVFRRLEFAWLGLLALTVCAFQGGPITKLVTERLHPTQRVWTPGELNQHQVVKLTFPKKQLFQIQLAHGKYQRLSCVYSCLPELGPITAITPGTPYRALWSWDVLKIHWLATLLAPWTFWALWRERDRPQARVLGFTFWSLGLFAFLIPGLVHFGPIYEFEYFRWQFAAGFSFAAALGLAVALFLKERSPRVKASVSFLLVFVCGLGVLFILLPRVWQAWRNQGEWLDPIRPRPTSSWILSHSTSLGHFDYFDLLAAAELRELSQPGQRLLVNAPAERAADIHFESTLTGLTGIRSVGHSLPWDNEPVGTPPFHRSAPARVFWRYPSAQLLAQLRVDWLLVRPSGVGAGVVRSWCQSAAAWQDGDYRLYAIDRNVGASFSEVSETADGAPLPVRLPSLVQVETAELIAWKELAQADPGQRVWAWGFIKAGQSYQQVDLHEVISWSGGPCAVVTPALPGDYELCIFEVRDKQLRATGQTLKVRVQERKASRH